MAALSRSKQKKLVGDVGWRAAQALVARSRGEFDVPLHPKQKLFVNSQKYYAAMVGGIGSGKSIAGCVRAIKAAYGNVGGVRIKTPNLGMITAPTYPMLRDATLRTFKEYAGNLLVYYNISEHRAVMSNGSEILFRSTHDPDTLRGPNLSWWFADEAALGIGMVWKIMIGRLRQFGKRGYAWLATTPRGRNWLWQVFQDAYDDYHPDKFIIHSSTYDNIFQERAFAEGLKSEYTGDFADQEIFGMFVAWAGLIYSEFNTLRHVTSVLPDMFKSVVAGVDWGFANPGCIEVGGLSGDDHLTIVDEHYAAGLRIGEWVEIGKQMRNRWGIKRFYCDPSEPDYIDDFNAAGLKAEAANNSVNTGIQKVKARLAGNSPRVSVHKSVVHLQSECEQYVWAANKHGIKDAPVKAKDHAMDAWRYMIMGIDYRDEETLTVSRSNWIYGRRGDRE